jgi:hypothetical protein
MFKKLKGLLDGLHPKMKIPAGALTGLTVVAGVASAFGAIPAAAPLAGLVFTITQGFTAYFAPRVPGELPVTAPRSIP